MNAARTGSEERLTLTPGEPIVISRAPGEALRVRSDVPFVCGRSLLFAADFTHTLHDGERLTIASIGTQSGSMRIERRPASY